VKVEYRRSGGYSGLVAGCDLDTVRMAPGEAEELTGLLRACLRDLPSPPSPEMRDDLIHEIRLEEDDGTSRTLRLDDTNLSASAGLLLEFLGQRSSPLAP
jgi:hypothetical protein